MNKALICVDVQQDFLPGGELGVPDGHRATPLLWTLMDEVDYIVFTRDWHPPDHVSFVEPGLNPEYRDGSWPPHCVQGTEGAEIDELLWEKALKSGKPILLVHKGDDKTKEAYSGFAGTVVDTFNRDAFPYLDGVGTSDEALLWNNAENRGYTLIEALDMLNVDTVKIGGIALDYCVKATALDAQGLGLVTTVYLNATRPVDYLTSLTTVQELVTAGVTLNPRQY